MKCACGYEGGDFTSLIVRTMEVWEDGGGEYFENDVFRQKIYACPKCGTLKVEAKE